jgi:hypothetical protein
MAVQMAAILMAQKRQLLALCYATTLFDMTRRSMPMDKPGTITNDEVYAITAWLLYLNNIIGEDDVMNAETLPKVQMPNRDGFINVYEEEQ